MATKDPPGAAQIRRAFGTRLRSLRLARGWRPKDVAEKLGIRYHRYIKYEEGLREPPFWLLIRMARLYNVTIDFLLAGPEGERRTLPVAKLRV